MPQVRKKFKKGWLWWVLLTVVIVFLSRAAFSEFGRRQALQRELAEREKKIEEVSEGIGELTGELEEVSDPRRVEKEARRTLNLKREGEEVFVVVGLDDIKQPEDFSVLFDESFQEQTGVWLNVKQWLQYFFR